MLPVTLSLIALSLTACASQNEPKEAPDSTMTSTNTQGLMAGPGYTWADVSTAYNRAQRIRDLLANCTGAGATDAGAAAAQMKQAQSGLGDLSAGITTNTQTNRDNAIEAMLDAQAVAYTAAVACGLTSPNVPDPGGWNATWDDISS